MATKRKRGGCQQGHFNHFSIYPIWCSGLYTVEGVSGPSWVRRECKHTRQHLWQNVRSLFGGSGWGGRDGVGTTGLQQQFGGRMWQECKMAYVWVGCSSGLVLFEALLWSWVQKLGKWLAVASVCSAAPSAAEVTECVLWTVTGREDPPGWSFVDGFSPSVQKDLLRKSARKWKEARVKKQKLLQNPEIMFKRPLSL